MLRGLLRWKQLCDLSMTSSTVLKSTSHVSCSNVCARLSKIHPGAYQMFLIMTNIPTVAHSHILCTYFMKVGWDASVESLKSACSILDCPEVIPFLDEYLLRMITILVSQRCPLFIVVHVAFLFVLLSSACNFSISSR